jgi:WD40 repeat protein
MKPVMSIVRARRWALGLLVILGLATGLQAQGPPAIQWMRGGHLHWIEQLVYSSDGTFFASSGRGDGTVKIWRASDGLLLRTLFVPRGSLVALSPDNATLCGAGAAAGTGPLIRCWRVADGAELWTTDTIPGTNPGDSVSKLAFSPDGQRLASAVGFRLPIWNASDGAFLADFAGQAPQPFAGGLSYSPDGQFLAVNTAWDNPRIALLDPSDGSLIWDFGASSVSFGYDMAFSPDSQLVASVNGIGLHVFGAYDHIRRPFDTGWPATTVAFSPDGTRIASGYFATGALNLFNTATGKLVRQWDAHGNSQNRPAVVFSADSTKLLSGNFDIKRWNASNGNFDALVTGQVGPVWLVAASEAVIAVAPNPLNGPGSIDEHVISLFRASDGALLRYIEVGASDILRGLALSPDGKHVAAADNTALRVWNVATGALEHSRAENGGNSSFRPIAYTPDGASIAVGGTSTQFVWLWNLASDTLTPIIAAPVRALQYLPAPDGRLVIVQPVPSTYLTIVKIVRSNGVVDQQMFDLQSISSLAVSPDGTMIAAGGVDGAYSPYYVTRLWRASDGAALQTLVGHTSTINGVAFSWDSRTVITGSQDATVRIWRASDAAQLRLYDQETYPNGSSHLLYDGVYSVAASNQSGRFVYGRGDATIVVANNPDASPAILTFTVPSEVTGSCKPATAKIVLDRPAPPSGITISLSSSSPDADVPNAITIKAGATQKSFKITTAEVGALQNATITATLGGDAVDRPLAIRPIGVSSLTLTPNPVTGGTPVSGVVTLECAGPAGVTVHLSSSIPSAAQPAPSDVAIPSGQKTGNVAVTTAPVSATKKPSIKAETVPDAQSKSKKLVVTP